MGLWRWLFGRPGRNWTCPQCGEPVTAEHGQAGDARCSNCKTALRVDERGVVTADSSQPLSVATVVVSNICGERAANETRMSELQEVVTGLLSKQTTDTVILFPGGWFDARPNKAKSLYRWVKSEIVPLLAVAESKVAVCCGVDGHREQLAAAITKDGMGALARKFSLARGESDLILASNHLASEQGLPRVLTVGNKRLFLSVCADDGAIARNSLSVPDGGIDAILSFVHVFMPRPDPGSGARSRLSGDSEYARHFLAGASKAWHCRVFAAVVFWERRIPDWPTGVLWSQGTESTGTVTYEQIRIDPYASYTFHLDEGLAQVRVYDI